MILFLLLIGTPVLFAVIVIFWRMRVAEKPEIRALGMSSRDVEARASFMRHGTPEERSIVRAHAPHFFMMVRLTEVIFVSSTMIALGLVVAWKVTG